MGHLLANVLSLHFAQMHSTIQIMHREAMGIW